MFDVRDINIDLNYMVNLYNIIITTLIFRRWLPKYFVHNYAQKSLMVMSNIYIIGVYTYHDRDYKVT